MSARTRGDNQVQVEGFVGTGYSMHKREAHGSLPSVTSDEQSRVFEAVVTQGQQRGLVQGRPTVCRRSGRDHASYVPGGSRLRRPVELSGVDARGNQVGRHGVYFRWNH